MSRWPRWLALALAGASASLALSLFFIGQVEFGALRKNELNIDELYFYSCAVRGMATGALASAGCHDNKAPLIYALYQWVQPHAFLYDAVAGKLAALSLLLLLVSGVAALAWRLSGRFAALAAGLLALSALVLNYNFLALKTETFGTLFVVAALLTAVLPRKTAAWHAGAVGLWLGLAVLVKQTNAIYAGCVAIWLCCRVLDQPAAGLKARGMALVWLGAGTVLPFLGYLGLMSAQGQADDFLESFFLYPSVYADGPPRGLSELATRFALLLERTVQQRELLCLAFVVGAVQTLRACWPWRERSPAATRRLLVLMSAGAALAVLMVSPRLFANHVVPAWILMSVLAGTTLGDLWQEWRDDPSAQASGQLHVLAAVLFFSTFLTAASVWFHNGNRGSLADVGRVQPTVDAKPGEYAFVLGMYWPSFYTDNGLIPASDVLFPWALPNMTKSEYYTPARPGTALADRLARVQERNLRKLMDDFRKTPPAYIGVVSEMAKADNSTRISDVPGIDEYLQAHCLYLKTLVRERTSVDHPMAVYRCQAASKPAG